MLKKKYRLSIKPGIRFQSSFKTPIFTLRFSRNDFLYNRYSVVVSKKVDKRAVVRNKLKRKITDVIKQTFSKIKTSYDIVFFATKQALDLSDSKLEEEVVNVLRKAGCLK